MCNNQMCGRLKLSEKKKSVVLGIWEEPKNKIKYSVPNNLKEEIYNF